MPRLQEMLWTRLQGRCASRSSTALTAGLCKAMAAELAFSGGTLGNVIMRGKPPRDPYDQAKLFIDHDSDGPSGARRTGASLQLEDVHLLERFYNQLCLLVEAQKASDPLSLVIVQLVRVMACSWSCSERSALHDCLLLPQAACGAPRGCVCSHRSRSCSSRA